MTTPGELARQIMQQVYTKANFHPRLDQLKEPLSRLANRQDHARGAFFEERFKSVGDPGRGIAAGDLHVH